MSSREMQANVYGRRRRLENVLIEATSRLPDRSGIPKRRLQQLRIILARKIPTRESALAADDMSRRQAVLEIVRARVQAGYESPEQRAKWMYIVDMERQARIPLWQQREFIVATLKKRNDNEEISQFTLPEPSATIFLAALRRLLSETLKEVDRGGIEQGKIGMLERTLSSSNGGLSESSRQQRREALIYILRARRRAGIEGRPELNDEWGLMELLPLIGLTREELDNYVKMDDVSISIEKDALLRQYRDMPFVETSKLPVTTEYLPSTDIFVDDTDTSTTDRIESQYSRDSAPSPTPMQTSPTPSPRRLSTEYTPIPMSPLGLEDEESSFVAEDGSPRAQRVYSPIPLSPY
ncbi:MAG: hypothetical protein Q9195_006033 [Heterodermia aff. obscurata]